MKSKTPMIFACLYVLAWIVGLSSGGPTLELNATAQSVVHGFTAHRTGGLLQFIIAEGLTGIFLILFVMAVKMHTKQKTTANRVFTAAGTISGLLSLAMATAAIILITRTVPHGALSDVTHLNNAINRTDGPKMLLLALMALSGAMLPLRLPAWLRFGGYLLAASLVFSAIAYGLLLQNIAWSAYISGTLLLLWVGSLGIYVSTRSTKN